MANQTAIDPGVSTVKFNGRVMDIRDEDSDRHDDVLVRLILRQKDPGCPSRTLLPVIGKEEAGTLLERIEAKQFVEIDAHVSDSNDRSVLITIDRIKQVDGIDEFKSDFEVTGELTKRAKKKLPPAKGYPSSSMFDLRVAGVDLKVFDKVVMEEVKEIEVGAQVTARGYVKCYINGESLRSVLYVESIEEI